MTYVGVYECILGGFMPGRRIFWPLKFSLRLKKGSKQARIRNVIYEALTYSANSFIQVASFNRWDLFS